MMIHLNVRELNKTNAEFFEQIVSRIHGIERVDTWPGRAEIDVQNGFDVSLLKEKLRDEGFTVSFPQQTYKFCINGMTCRSCELTIERALKKLPGMSEVHANTASGVVELCCDQTSKIDVEQLQTAINDKKYTVRPWSEKKASFVCEERPTFLRLIGLFALVLLLGSILEKLGLGQSGTVTQTMSFAAVVVLGLVAGTSSCLAVSGGLLLSSAAKFNARYANASTNDRMRPVFLFVIGRVVAYGLLGGLIGLLGQIFTFSPLITGGLIILAAVYMITMGLDMLKISPKWLKACMPRMPKGLSHKIMDAEGKEHWSAPFLLGAATFFLPCGFTQSLQVLALTTGSFVQSAVMLAGFALGTAPALLALGFASSSLKGKTGKLFFQFSGALVIVLGLWNIQNGLVLTGFTLPDFTREVVAGPQVSPSNAEDKNVKLVNNVQTIQLSLIGTDPYYAPSDTFTVKAGIPVKIQVNGVGTGCRSELQIPKLGVSTYLNKQVNVLEFTPKKAGSFAFSCGMGMYRGTLNVVAS